MVPVLALSQVDGGAWQSASARPSALVVTVREPRMAALLRAL
jgi:hypothetical protein